MTNFEYLMKNNKEEVKDALFKYFVKDKNTIKKAIIEEFKDSTLANNFKLCTNYCENCEGFPADCSFIIKSWLNKEN